ncbi:MAG: aminotransferase class III-fold pyridoxal phosphate-dependent enzyme [Rhodospirillaceae bacterium]|nr:aminotransferase class III-fold pyridoxal phosphate-dependent enzyme [Rhodospirillaceae bacterium]
MPDLATALSATTTQSVLARARAAANNPAASALAGNIDVAGGLGRFSATQATGARIVDRAGGSYLDLCMGYGALVLGHAAAPVKDALQRQLEQGWMYGFAHPQQDQLAELIRAAAPGNERVALCNSESDATLLALRAARAVTGRDKIAVFGGSHHGLHDFALVGESTSAARAANDAPISRRGHRGAGIPKVIDEFVVVLPYGDPTAIDWIRSYAGQLAAVIAEPFVSARPSLQHKAWLLDMQAICRSTHTVFVLDETYSGFRLGYGGAQELLGLSPDLVTYGNAMGGGLPIGAVAGRASAMAPFTASDSSQRIFSGTAHAGNPLSVAAATAVLEVLLTYREEIYPQLGSAANNLVDAFNATANDIGARAKMSAAGSVCAIQFEPGQETIERDFYRALHARKIIVHASRRCFLSTAHTVADIIEISSALDESLRIATGS